MEEIWKFYKETKYSNKYFKKGDILTVSNCGCVKLNGKLYICPIINGYYYLCHIPLHRIIAEKFLSDWDPTKQVDHKDTNRLNNRVDNLCMCSSKENNNNPLTIQHKIENSRPKKPVIQYTLDNIFVKEYISIKEAERQTNIYQGSIVECCKQRRKSAGGYIWKYK